MSRRSRKPAILEFVLVEARRPSVASRAVPGSSERWRKGSATSSAEIGRGSSRPARLGGQANTCPLSSGSFRTRDRMERYREARKPSACPSFLHPSVLADWNGMNVFELTRALVDIESITENEERMGSVLFAHLSELAAQYRRACRTDARRAPAQQCSRLVGRTNGHALHAHGHRAAVLPFARRR